MRTRAGLRSESAFRYLAISAGILLMVQHRTGRVERKTRIRRFQLKRSWLAKQENGTPEETEIADKSKINLSEVSKRSLKKPIL